jgi:hypothetical protein
MFMSASAAIPVETPVPNPATLGEDKPSRFGRLIDVVRKLIDYGRELATTLQRRAATTDLLPIPAARRCIATPAALPAPAATGPP